MPVYDKYFEIGKSVAGVMKNSRTEIHDGSCEAGGYKYQKQLYSYDEVSEVYSLNVCISKID